MKASGVDRGIGLYLIDSVIHGRAVADFKSISMITRISPRTKSGSFVNVKTQLRSLLFYGNQGIEVGSRPDDFVATRTRGEQFEVTYWENYVRKGSPAAAVVRKTPQRGFLGRYPGFPWPHTFVLSALHLTLNPTVCRVLFLLQYRTCDLRG